MLLFALGLMGHCRLVAHQRHCQKTIHMNGLTRFTAACMLSGYGWLIIASVLFIAFGLMHPNSQYLLDPALHSFSSGLFSPWSLVMLLPHFPIHHKVKMPWSPTFYAPGTTSSCPYSSHRGSFGDFGVQQWGLEETRSHWYYF